MDPRSMIPPSPGVAARSRLDAVSPVGGGPVAAAGGAVPRPSSPRGAGRPAAERAPVPGPGAPPPPTAIQMAVVGLFNLMPFGVVTIGLDGTILWANAQGTAMLKDSESLMAVGGRLCDRVRGHAGLLAAALEAIRADLAAGRTPSIAVLSPSHLLPEEDTSALLVPMGWADEPQVAVLLCPKLTRRLDGIEPFLMRAFGLTRSEAELARVLADGGTVEDFSCRRGITIGTARWHLRNVLFKLGCARQGHAVARLLASPLTLIDLAAAGPPRARPVGGRPR